MSLLAAFSVLLLSALVRIPKVVANPVNVPDALQPGGLPEVIKIDYGMKCPSKDKRIWRTIDCLHDGATNASSGTDPKTRWEQLDSAGAWCDMIDAWGPERTVCRETTLPGAPGPEKDPEGFGVLIDNCFPNHISNVANGPYPLRCQELNTANGCGGTTETCNVFDTRDSGAGAMFIFNSFINLHNLMQSQYDVVNEAINSIDITLDEFVKTFSPDKKDNDLLIQIIVNVISVAGGLALSPAFNFYFRNLPVLATKGDKADTIKESTFIPSAAAVSSGKDIQEKRSYVARAYPSFAFYQGKTQTWSRGISKLALAQGKDKEEEANLEVRSAFIGVLDNWKLTITKTVAEFFLGRFNDITRLGKVIADGKLINPVSKTAFETELHWRRVLYTHLIPHGAWHARGITPVVLDTGKDCKDVDKSIEGVSHVKDEEGKKSHACVDGKLYLLMDVHGKANVCGRLCKPIQFSLLPGADALERGTFADVSFATLVEAAVKSDKKFGRNKMGSFPDITNEKTFNTVYEDLQKGKPHLVPGVVTIPVCSVEEAYKNWQKHYDDDKPRYAKYPCNAAT